MQANEYQKLCWHTALPFYKTDTDSVTFKQLQLTTMALALAGEAGELCNKLKKFIEHGDFDYKSVDILLEELGDVQWYTGSFACLLNAKLEDVMAKNISKLRERYPDGFPDKMNRF